jgi:hypothetical protein
MPAPSISRRIPKRMQAPSRAYATVIGEVIWASNFAHGAFEILFSHVATHDNYPIGRAIWHTAASDSGQLQMLRAAATASTRLSEQMRARILWSIDKALKLGEMRNDAVHSATIVLVKNGQAMMAPSDIGTKPSRSEKLRREGDLKKKFRSVKGDLLQLGQYIHSLWPHLAGFDLLPPLPRKPQLRSLPKQTHRKATRARAK